MAEELIDGAEYEAEFVGGGLVRGIAKSVNVGAGPTHAWPHNTTGRATAHMENPKNKGSGWFVWRDTLRRVESATAPIADGDRLYEGSGCCLCGASEWEPGIAFVPGGGKLSARCANAGSRCCHACLERFVWETGSDQEISRRRKLASGSVGSVGTATRKDAAATPPGGVDAKPTQPAGPERPKPDPYAEYRARNPDTTVAIYTAVLDAKRGNRQREAFRQLDRKIAGPKYPDGVLWEAFSSPSWDGEG